MSNFPSVPDAAPCSKVAVFRGARDNQLRAEARNAARERFPQKPATSSRLFGQSRLPGHLNENRPDCLGVSHLSQKSDSLAVNSVA
jgi:hypothetical protein